MRRGRRERDRVFTLLGKVVGAVAAVGGAVLLLRSLPDLVRYVKLDRM